VILPREGISAPARCSTTFIRFYWIAWFPPHISLVTDLLPFYCGV
jgi:hypothetical protein